MKLHKLPENDRKSDKNYIKLKLIAVEKYVFIKILNLLNTKFNFVNFVLKRF